MSLVPANGRDYRSQKAVLEGINSGKDFIIRDMFDPYDGKPINIQDMEVGRSYYVRYARNRKVMSITVRPHGAVLTK